MRVDTERMRSVFYQNAFALLLNSVGFFIVKLSWFLIGTRLALVRSCLASRLNVFGFSSQRIWLLVRMRLASRPNMVGLSSERVWLLVQMRPGSGSNSFVRGANAFERQMCYTLCLTGTVTVGKYTYRSLLINFLNKAR